MSNARTLANTINASSQIVVPSGGIAFTDLNSSNDAATANEDYVMGQDGYEEGTWTPNAVSGFTGTFSISRAIYTKIGRMVYFELQLTFTNNPTVFSNPQFSLPFVSEGRVDCFGRLGETGVRDYITTASTGTGASIIAFGKISTGANTSISQASMTITDPVSVASGDRIEAFGSYRTTT